MEYNYEEEEEEEEEDEEKEEQENENKDNNNKEDIKKENGKVEENNMVEFKYPEKIEKKNLINQSKTTNYNNFKYEIFVVLKQYKINNNFQYILYIKNFVNNTWYSYNNQNIRKTDINEATSDYKNTCLIIYQKTQ